MTKEREPNLTPVPAEMQKTPENFGAEQNTIGAMLFDPSVIGEAMEFVSWTDFHREEHKPIAKAIFEIYDEGGEVNLWTVSDRIRKLGNIKEVGGEKYLQALQLGCPGSAAIASYAKPVFETSQQRRMLEVGKNIQTLVYRGELASDRLIETSEQLVFGVSNRVLGDRPRALGEEVSDAVARIYEQVENPGGMGGLPLGFTELDRLTRLIKPGQFVILAARPAVGKTSLAIQFILYAARFGPVIFFSLEMTKEEIIERMLMIVAGVNTYDLESGSRMTEIEKAAAQISKLPIFILDRVPMTTFEMRIQARRLAAQHGTPALIVLDHAEEAELAKAAENKRIKIETVVKDFRDIGRLLKCPMLVLSQLARKLEDREDKRPILSDLRETGYLEAIANFVIFLYRQGYHKAPESQGPSWGAAQRFPAEIIVAKARGGRRGTIHVDWVPDYTRFEEIGGIQQ